jgi:glyoxylase-like metal-dependent hydrolase (beta-lactamase superfamily II)
MSKIKIHDVRVHVGDSAFLIDDGKTSIMYDSGFGFTGFKVADKIKEILGERSLDYIFLTHSHYDHALGSAYVLKIWPDAKVVAGEYAAKIFAKPTARSVMRDLDNKYASRCGVSEYEDLIDELCVDTAVNDGDIIMAGDMKFTCVAFPGHTKCSVGYYLAENKLLLGSETLGVYGGKGVVFPSYLIGYEITMNSIKKAERMDIQSILVPHFGILEGDEAAEYIALGKVNAMQTAEGIADILKNGGSDEDAYRFFKEKYYHGYIEAIYPEDAMELNTSIMVNLIKNELLS